MHCGPIDATIDNQLEVWTGLQALTPLTITLSLRNTSSSSSICLTSVPQALNCTFHVLFSTTHCSDKRAPQHRSISVVDPTSSQVVHSLEQGFFRGVVEWSCRRPQRAAFSEQLRPRAERRPSAGELSSPLLLLVTFHPASLAFG